jgi:cysteinyl-tRNA synthetase
LPPAGVALDWNEPHAKNFKAAMDDDFGTPEAVAVLFDLASRVNSGERHLAPQLRALGGVLGLLQRDATQFLQGGRADDWVLERIAAREAARKRKDFSEADRIRDELLAKGIILEDGPQGTTWRRA